MELKEHDLGNIINYLPDLKVKQISSMEKERKKIENYLRIPDNNILTQKIRNLSIGTESEQKRIAKSSRDIKDSDSNKENNSVNNGNRGCESNFHCCSICA